MSIKKTNKSIDEIRKEELQELFKNESLTITEKAYNLLLEIISIIYILDNDKPNKEQRHSLEQEREKLEKQFFKEFKKSNKKQVKMYKDYQEQKNK